MKNLIPVLFLLPTCFSSYAQERSKQMPSNPNTIEYWDFYINSAQKKLDYLNSNPLILEESKKNGKYYEVLRAIENGKEERRKLTEKTEKSKSDKSK